MSEKNPIQAVDRKHALLVWADTVDAFNARLGNALDELQEAGFPVEDVAFGASDKGFGALIVVRGQPSRAAFSVS